MSSPSPLFTFSGGGGGPWRILGIRPVVGESLPAAPFLDILNDPAAPAPGAAWNLRGAASYERYVASADRPTLASPPPLGRPEASCAALIPISKSPAWWALPQDERRAIMEARSAHTATGLQYVPAIARKLHHGRDLGEPFDFLTWFEYAPQDAAAFEDLVGALRATEEWSFVSREVDVRLVRAD